MNNKILIENIRSFARNDLFDEFELLMNCITDYNFADDKGFTPLIICAYEGNMRMVQHLVENLNVDLDKKDKNDYNPLIQAYFGNHKEIFTYLLDNGASTDSISSKGLNIVDFLIGIYVTYEEDENIENFIEYVELSITHGANINNRSSSGATILMRACKNISNEDERIKLLKFLLEKGANAHIHDYYKNNVLNYLSDKWTKIIALFDEYGLTKKDIIGYYMDAKTYSLINSNFNNYAHNNLYDYYITRKYH